MLDPEAGKRLRDYMEPRIGNVQPWAERHGIGRDTIYALWRGREPRADTLNRIADALGTTYEELLRVRAGVGYINRAALPDDFMEEMREHNRINRELVAHLRQLVQTFREDQASRLEEWAAQQEERAPKKPPRPKVHRVGTKG